MSDSGFEIVREFNVDLIGLLNFMPIAMEDYFLILLSKDPISSL